MIVLLVLLVVASTAPANSQDQDLRWPLAMAPALSSTFGETRATAFHAGLDLKTWGKTGYAVHAAADGWIERARMSPWGNGRVIYLRMNDGRIAVYAHLDSFFTPVQQKIRAEQQRLGHYSVQLWFEKGKVPVQRGEVIGFTGETGGGPPHLHFELRDAANVPLNPLLHAFKVADTEAPTLRRLLIVPRGAGSLADGDHAPVVVPVRWHAATQRFVAARSVTVFGRFGIGVELFDTANAADNKMAALRQALIVDGREVFSSRLHRVPFGDGHQVALDRWRQGDFIFSNLFQRPGNRLAFYESDGNAGWLFAGGQDLGPGEHEIEVVASDVSGNESRATLTLQVASSYAQALAGSAVVEKAPAVELVAYERFAVLKVNRAGNSQLGEPQVTAGGVPLALQPRPGGHTGLISYATLRAEDSQYLQVDVRFGAGSDADTTLTLTTQSIGPGQSQDLTYDQGRMILHLEAGSAYEQLVPQVSSAPPEAASGVRATGPGYTVEPQTISFDKWARVSFAMPDGKDASKLGVYVSDGEGGWVFIGNQFEEQRISARIRAFGTFALLEDVARPTISTLLPRSQTWIDERRPLLRARVVDRGSGFGKELDLEIELDGRKLIHIYDPEADVVEARPDRPLADGEHVWTVTARDQAGNSTEVSDVFGLR